MKKILVLIILMAASATYARSYGPSGCGLGAVLFEGKSDKVSQVLASTTNGTSGNQTFGITTGTLNCDTERLTISKITFIEANKSSLANDIARGNGETLAALGSLYGCSNLQGVSKKMQKDYGVIFNEVSPNAQSLNEKFNSYMTACI